METKEQLLEEMVKEAEQSLNYHQTELAKDQTLYEAGFNNEFGVRYETKKIKTAQLKLQLLKSIKI